MATIREYDQSAVYCEPEARESKPSRSVFSSFSVACFNYIRSSIRSTGQYFLRERIYPLSSSKIKLQYAEDRLEKSRKVLEMIGGERITLHTSDGAALQAMFFDVQIFHKRILEQGGSFFTNENGELVLRLYNDFILDLFETLFKQTAQPVVDDDYGFENCKEIVLSPPLQNDQSIPLIHESRAMILTQGNYGILEVSRKMIMDALLTGQSCLIFNLRGTGKSSHSPHEEGTYSDVTAAYRYLKSKSYKDDQITVRGYCLGSGLATELAKDFPIHLVLDRPFGKIGDPMIEKSLSNATQFLHQKLKMGKVFQLMGWVGAKSGLDRFGVLAKRKLAMIVNSMIISYDNASKLGQARASVCLIQSNRDQMIPSFSREEMQRVAVTLSAVTIHESGSYDHVEPWDLQTTDVYQRHLLKFGLLRKFPETPI